MAASGLSCLARNGRAGVPALFLARGREPRGRKSRSRHCGKMIEAQPSCSQITPSMRPHRSRARRPLGRRHGGHGATQEVASLGKERKTPAYGKAS
jgi:hypothetical protein